MSRQLMERQSFTFNKEIFNLSLRVKRGNLLQRYCCEERWRLLCFVKNRRGNL